MRYLPHILLKEHGNTVQAVTETINFIDDNTEEKLVYESPRKTGNVVVRNDNGYIIMRASGFTGGFATNKIYFAVGCSNSVLAFFQGNLSQRMPLGLSGTFKYLRVKLASSTLQFSAVITLIINGVATELTCTIPSGSLYAEDITHIVSYQQGDLATVEFSTTGGSTGSTGAITITLQA